MFDFLTKQVLLLILVMLGVSVAVFVMMNYTPGGAIEAMVLRGGAQVSGEDLARFREQMGLNDPLPTQYLRFLGNALQGDLGRSLRNNRPVVQILREQLPATVELAVASTALAVILGMILGLISAVRHDFIRQFIERVFYHVCSFTGAKYQTYGRIFVRVGPVLVRVIKV